MAVRRGKFERLNEGEEAEFQKAMFGHGKRRRIKVPMWLNAHVKNS